MFNYAHDYRLQFDQQPRHPAVLSTNNLKNLHWGDKLKYPRPKNTFRVYCQNVNGLKIDDQGGELQPISEFLREYQCNLVGLTEINLSVSKYKVRTIISDTLSRSFDAHQCSMSASTIPFDSYYQPGGTLTAVFNDTVCRFKSKSSDPMGRWSRVS
jgi:hypothetical protein